MIVKNQKNRITKSKRVIQPSGNALFTFKKNQGQK